MLLDCYQSSGTVPFNVRELDVDMVCGGSVKWLCGGPGAGYLYVQARRCARGSSRAHRLDGARAPFRLREGRAEVRAGRARLLHGTPAVPALYAARAGYEIIAQAGVANIRAQERGADAALPRARGRRAGLTSRSPRDPARRGGSVTVQVPHAPAVVAALAERDILVDCRPDVGLRVSPHFYNTDEELDFLDAVTDILRHRSVAEARAQDTAY